MSRKIISRYLPDPDRILQARHLQFLRRFLAEPGLWHLNRRSAAGAVFWGLYCTFIPLPVQTLATAVAAIAFRVNLPLCMALVCISNPLTVVPLLYYSYVLGCHLLGQTALDVGSLQALLLTLFSDAVGMLHGRIPRHDSHQQLLLPLVLGSQVAGLVAGGLGFAGLRLFWRWQVVRAWRRRAARRRVVPAQPGGPA